MKYVCDSIMGSGKTEAVFRYINEHPEYRYIYITPLLLETERIRESCPDAGFVLPHSVWGNDPYSRVAQIRDLVRDGRNIAYTQASFRVFGADIAEDLAKWNYILILDEIVSAVSLAPVYESDIKVLAEAGYADYDEASRSYSYTGKPYGEGILTESIDYLRGCGLFTVEGSISGRNAATPLYYWDMLPEVFNAFKDVYILDYHFNINEYRYYMEKHDMPYSQVYVSKGSDGAYRLTDNENERYIPEYLSHLGDFITIAGLDRGSGGSIGRAESDLTRQWYSVDGKRNAEVARNRIRRFFRQDGLPSSKCMWTTFRGYEGEFLPNGFASGFVSPDTRGTLLYSNKEQLAYCVNLYPTPSEYKYINSLGYSLDPDEYALVNMVKWIWRSRIRNGEHIHILIPSLRMKGLFVNWIGDIQGSPYTRSDYDHILFAKRSKLEKYRISRAIQSKTEKA